MNRIKKKLQFLYIFCATIFILHYPVAVNAQAAGGLFSGGQKAADDVFKSVPGTGGADVSIVGKLLFGAISLFLFVAAVWQAIRAYQEGQQSNLEGANWAPILYGLVGLALLIVTIGFASKIIFGA
jgi:hypothetical protein